MVIASVPGIAPVRILEVLREIERSLRDVQGGPITWSTRYESYIRWAAISIRALGGIVPSHEINRLITTPRYWALVTMTQFNSTNVLSLTQTEIEERLREFSEISETLRREIERWSAFEGCLLVPDTNVYLHSEKPFQELVWRELIGLPGFDGLRLVIVSQVLKELDRKKRSSSTNRVSRTNSEEVRSRATQTLRTINRLFIAPSLAPTLVPASAFQDDVSVCLFLDRVDHVSLLDADNEILDRTVALQDISGKRTIVVTYDTSMALSARNIGLECKLLESFS